jgi:hypothetical protein
VKTKNDESINVKQKQKLGFVNAYITDVKHNRITFFSMKIKSGG